MPTTPLSVSELKTAAAAFLKQRSGVLVRDLGDFQTPPELARQVLECLGAGGESWPRVLEPNCGEGNFIRELLRLPIPPREIIGLEIQQSHLDRASELVSLAPSTHLRLEKADVFHMHFGRDISWREEGPLLVVGNPPWVTSSELGALGSGNLPRKTNIRELRGIDAMTGESNFDIAESIWLKLIRELASQQPTIAMLCKSSVARNVLQFVHGAGLSISNASMRLIDAKTWFGASVDACLLRLQVGAERPCYEIAVFDGFKSKEAERVTGIVNGTLVPNLLAYGATAFADGQCALTWRQGVKHDAAAVMELRPSATGLKNGLDEAVEIEGEYVYPLLKGRDVFSDEVLSPRLRVVVTQRQLGEETLKLQVAAPNLWKYLSDHEPIFEKRKSSIYRNQPPFAMFGIGPYSFSTYKVGVSGLHKQVRFRAIGPFENKPVLLDDTCYFVPCVSGRQAALLTALLNDPRCLEFLHSVVFWDSKRPIKKSVLRRIDLRAILHVVSRDGLLGRANRELERLEGTEFRDSGVWDDPLEEVLLATGSDASAPLVQHTFDSRW